MTNKGDVPMTLQYMGDPQMDALLRMTHYVFMKIKKQTKEMMIYERL